jgi:hypothetical protein
VTRALGELPQLGEAFVEADDGPFEIHYQDAVGSGIERRAEQGERRPQLDVDRLPVGDVLRRPRHGDRLADLVAFDDRAAPVEPADLAAPEDDAVVHGAFPAVHHGVLQVSDECVSILEMDLVEKGIEARDDDGGVEIEEAVELC